jgi:hypothetical protein
MASWNFDEVGYDVSVVITVCGIDFIAKDDLLAASTFLRGGAVAVQLMVVPIGTPELHVSFVGHGTFSKKS